MSGWEGLGWICLRGGYARGRMMRRSEVRPRVLDRWCVALAVRKVGRGEGGRGGRWTVSRRAFVWRWADW